MVRPQEHNLLELLAHVVGEHVGSQYGRIAKACVTVTFYLQNKCNYIVDILRFVQFSFFDRHVILPAHCDEAIGCHSGETFVFSDTPCT